MDLVLLAVDGGPRETLLPLAEAAKRALEDVTSVEAADESHWQRVFESRSADLLVVGTSDSAGGRLIEGAARRAARRAGLAIVAIEDFPANYSHVPEGEASLVLAESTPARELLLQKLGVDSPAIEVMALARYDVLRVRLSEIRSSTALRWETDERTRAARRVLWAGQPETQDCVRTLQAVLPVLRTHGVELFFKAHPRDPGYASGLYREQLEQSRVPFEDVTSRSISSALDASPALVVTQFSSVAIEAGFRGIPGICILLPDAGGASLREKKGYAAPPFCAAGAVALAQHVSEVGPSLGKALCDHRFRAALMSDFDRYFEVSELKASALAERVGRLAAERK